MTTRDIVALCGSLRAASVNRHVVQLAREVLPEGASLTLLEWREVPVFDADDYARGLPASVATLRERIRAADGVLIATPEYNFSIPGGLKNLIDWLSRGEDQPFNAKPVAIVSGAAPGPLGGARAVRPAQSHAVPQRHAAGQARGLHRPRTHQVRRRNRPLHRRHHAQVRHRPDGGLRALDRRGRTDARLGPAMARGGPGRLPTRFRASPHHSIVSPVPPRRSFGKVIGCS